MFYCRAGAGFIVPEWLPTWDNLEFGAAVAQLDRVIYGLIAKRRQQLQQDVMHASHAAVLDHSGSGADSSQCPMSSASIAIQEGLNASNAHAGNYSHADAGTCPMGQSDADRLQSHSAAGLGPSRSGSSGSLDLLTSFLLAKDEDGSGKAHHVPAHALRDCITQCLPTKGRCRKGGIPCKQARSCSVLTGVSTWPCAGMTDAALRDELMTLLVAGQETSAILLGWTTALLAAHPQVQAAVQAEVDAVVNVHGGVTPDA